MVGEDVVARIRRELSPLLQVHRDGRPLRDVVDQLSPAMLAALDRVALLMLRPDALLDGRALEIARWLADEHGIDILRLAITPVPPRRFDAQYTRELSLIAPNLRVHHLVSAHGPAAFLLVHAASPGIRSLSSHLDRLKGPAAPSADSAPGSLRERFGRQSSFHVVAHTSEDAADVLAGGIAVFGTDALVALLEDLAEDRCRAIAPATVELLLGEIAAPAGRDVFAVALSIKRRIAAVLSSALDDPPEEIAELVALYDSTSLQSGARFAERRDAFIAMARRERPTLDRLIEQLEDATTPRSVSREASVARRWRARDAACAPVRLAYASWFLSGLESYDRDDGEAIFAVLDRSSIVLSPWERSIVTAGLVADLDPAASFTGVRNYPLDPPGPVDEAAAGGADTTPSAS
jgi:hypothetical protein